MNISFTILSDNQQEEMFKIPNHNLASLLYDNKSVKVQLKNIGNSEMMQEWFLRLLSKSETEGLE